MYFFSPVSSTQLLCFRVERETGGGRDFFLLNLNLHTGPRKPGFWLPPFFSLGASTPLYSSEQSPWSHLFWALGAAAAETI